jgi:hypothetical protein
MKAAEKLYDEDFYVWTQTNARLLRGGKLAEADLKNIAREIADMGKSNRREIESRFGVLVGHLLKWQFQPEERSSSWEATIRIQRIELQSALRQMPSLKRFLAANVPGLYPLAVAVAVRDTGKRANAFPAACPYTVAQILDESFFPEGD